MCRALLLYDALSVVGVIYVLVNFKFNAIARRVYLRENVLLRVLMKITELRIYFVPILNRCCVYFLSYIYLT